MSDSPCLPHDAQLPAALLKAFGQQRKIPVFGDGGQSLGPVSQHWGYCPVTPVYRIALYPACSYLHALVRAVSSASKPFPPTGFPKAHGRR